MIPITASSFDPLEISGRVEIQQMNSDTELLTFDIELKSGDVVMPKLRDTRHWATFAAVMLVWGLSGCSDRAIAEEAPAFGKSWESLQNYQCPEWFRDAKFGIYAHWGPYCVPAFPTTTDWYSHYMYRPGHAIHKYQVETYGPVSEFGYKDFVPQFTAPKFDAEAWAELYKESGARFAGPVAEHCDGFAFWDSAITEWDSVDKGPKRDVVAELEKAIRSRGLKYMTSFHHHWKWGWYATPIKDADCLDPQYEGLYGPALSPSAMSLFL